MSVRYFAGATLVAFLLATVASAGTLIQIEEFQSNPDGNDPVDQDVELSGTPLSNFDGWILSVESDASSSQGLVDRATEVSGSFDSEGILVVSIPDLENPSFTLILTDDFTGTVGTTDIDPSDDGVTLDVSALGTVLDAVGIPDTDGEPLYGAALGGTDFPYTGAEPELVFRDGVFDTWYAVNDNVTPSEDAISASGNAVPLSAFSYNPTPDSFGRVNPTVPEPGTIILVLFALCASAVAGLRARWG